MAEALSSMNEELWAKARAFAKAGLHTSEEVQQRMTDFDFTRNSRTVWTKRNSEELEAEAAEKMAQLVRVSSTQREAHELFIEFVLNWKPVPLGCKDIPLNVDEPKAATPTEFGKKRMNVNLSITDRAIDAKIAFLVNAGVEIAKYEQMMLDMITTVNHSDWTEDDLTDMEKKAAQMIKVFKLISPNLVDYQPHLCSFVLFWKPPEKGETLADLARMKHERELEPYLGEVQRSERRMARFAARYEKNQEAAWKDLREQFMIRLDWKTITPEKALLVFYTLYADDRERFIFMATSLNVGEDEAIATHNLAIMRKYGLETDGERIHNLKFPLYAHRDELRTHNYRLLENVNRGGERNQKGVSEDDRGPASVVGGAVTFQESHEVNLPKHNLESRGQTPEVIWYPTQEPPSQLFAPPPQHPLMAQRQYIQHLPSRREHHNYTPPAKAPTTAPITTSTTPQREDNDNETKAKKDDPTRIYLENVSMVSPIEGGDLFDCLSDSELDILMSKLLPSRNHVPARAFFDYRQGNTDAIFLSTARDCYIPLHCRHHWMMGYLTKNKMNQDTLLVYDSAPSALVRQDMARLASKLQWKLMWMSSAQQHRLSNECGLFAVRAAVRHSENLPNEDTRISLRNCRSLAARREYGKLREEFMKKTSIEGGAVNPPVTERSGDEARAADAALCYMYCALKLLNHIPATSHSLALKNLESAREMVKMAPGHQDAGEALRALHTTGFHDAGVFLVNEPNREGWKAPPWYILERASAPRNLPANGFVVGIRWAGRRVTHRGGLQSAIRGHYTICTSPTDDCHVALYHHEDTPPPQQAAEPEEEHECVPERIQAEHEPPTPTEEETIIVSSRVEELEEEEAEEVVPNSRVAEFAAALSIGDKVSFKFASKDGKKEERNGTVASRKQKMLKINFEGTPTATHFFPSAEHTYYSLTIFYTPPTEKPNPEESEKVDERNEPEEKKRSAAKPSQAPAPTTRKEHVPSQQAKPKPTKEVEVLPTKQTKPKQTKVAETTETLVPLRTDRRIWGENPRNWYIHKGRPSHIQPLAWDALSPETRAQHVRWLMEVKAMPHELSLTSPSFACAELIRRKSHKWAPSTTHRNAAALKGALRDLNFYTNSQGGIILDSTYEAFLRQLDRLRKQATPSPPPPVTYNDMQEIFKLRVFLDNENLQLRAFADLMWACAARPADVITLNCEDIFSEGVPSDHSATYVPIRVAIKRGKGAKLRGTYTIPTSLPIQAYLDLQAHMRGKAHTDRIFPWEDRHALYTGLRDAIKEVLPGASLPSIRKGAVRHLARAGIDEETLIKITGHARVETLHLYLGHGKVGTSDNVKVSNAARALHAPLPTVLGGGCQTIRDEKEETNPHRAIWPSGNDARNRDGQRYQTAMIKSHAPSWEELGISKQPTRLPKEKLPLHLKKITKIDLEKLREVARGTNTKFEEGWKFLDGSAFKGCITSRTIKNNRWAQADIDKLIAFGRIEPTPFIGANVPEGYHAASIFTVEEYEKWRARIITEPRINGCFDSPEKSSRKIAKVRLPHRLEKRILICRARYLLSLDYAAFYDAFVLPHVTRNNFLVKLNGRIYRLVTLATGGKWSVLVAESSTQAICQSSVVESIDYLTWIDNTIFAGQEGQEAQMKETAGNFFRISKEVGATLNDIEVDGEVYSPEEAMKCFEKIITPQRITILGEEYIASEGSYKVQNSEKTMSKLKAILEQLDDPSFKPTYRNLAARTSLCLYAAHTVSINPADLRDLLEGAGAIGREVGFCGWDARVEEKHISSNAVRNIATRLLNHPPVKPPHLAQPTYQDNDYDAIIMTDASKEGWGAIITTKTERWTVQRKWTTQEREYCQHSAAAEPKGANECLQWWYEKTGKKGRIALITDHHAIANAQRNPVTGFGGVGYGNELNRLYRTANDYTNDDCVHFFYVQGDHNLSDSLSRHLESVEKGELKFTQTSWVALPLLKSFFCKYAVEEAANDDDYGVELTEP